MSTTSVREYAILYVGKGGRKSDTTGGGNVVLNAGQHALDGPEHTGQLPADRVSLEDTGGLYAATDAEAAFAEVAQEVVDHTADTTDAHDASAISIVDAGGHYTGTDVEAALAEVGASIDALEARPAGDHQHIDNVAFSGDGSTTAFELPAAPFDEFSVKAFVAGLRTAVTLSGTMLTICTFSSAPASGTDNVVIDIVAVTS